ncbi:hypothetical protein ACFWIJ_40340, partial [Streptomyces sp. NPDC127079]|uniref:hypothetical protein n=1 Tax=Streptomyces sp. NPDC127079 TaxID=3347132 RepID=UPI00364B4F5F
MTITGTADSALTAAWVGGSHDANEFEDPLRRRRATRPAALRFGLSLPQVDGLAVDALQPHGIPDP